MKIVGYLRTSLIEWPGKISSVIFVPGCNFRCPFCHNSNLVNPQKVVKLPIVSEKEVLVDLKKRKKWIDGVVVTGGEPLLQSDLSRFLSRCKQMGFGTMIETNGALDIILQCMISKNLIDYVAMDFKAPLNKRYAKTVRVEDFDPKIIRKSIKLLLESSAPFELRTTIVPGIHNKKVLVEMAKQLKDILGKKKISWFWQNFQPKNCLDPKFEEKTPYKQEKLEEFLKAAKIHVFGAELRNY